MDVTLVHVYVKPEYVNDFIEATHLNHEASIQEGGNHRFDVLQDSTNECKFILYESYVSERDAMAHKQTEHYLKWRDTVAPMMEQPREGMKYNCLFPRY